jgi:IS30 family transposase
LFLGTNQDNIQDKISKGRSKINNRRLTNAEKVNILKLLEVKSKKDVAKTFNIHISTISRLKRSSIFDEQQNRV